MKSTNLCLCRPRKYILILTAIALLPLTLIHLITNGSLYKYTGYYIDNETKLQTLPNEAIESLLQTEMDAVEIRMKNRREYLDEKCSEYRLNILGNDSLHRPNAWEFLVNEKYHLIWCNVFKAASSSWMHNFNILAGYTSEFLSKTNEVALSLARKRYPRVSIEELRDAQNDSITFIIVRHPFERLLSAYKDKFMYAIPHSFHDKLGRSIVRRYRKNKPEQYSPQYPTFSEFITWILNEIHYNNHIDMHFIPATKFCTPCLIKFDFIIKFETLKEDQTYLIYKSNLQNIIKPEWKNSGKGKRTTDIIKTYFSQITMKQLEELYDYYRYDFEVFGYNASLYYSIVKDEHANNEIKTKD